MFKRRKEYKDRAKQYHDAIKQVLIKEWDPIGVKDEPLAQDEYDSYVPGVYKLLIRRKSEEKIFRYLWKIETDFMSLCGNRNHTKVIAQRLLEITKEIEG